MSVNLVSGLLEEMNRVREIIKQYEDPILKGAGKFAAELMKKDIREAERIIAFGDVLDMVNIYQQLKSWES